MKNYLLMLVSCVVLNTVVFIDNAHAGKWGVGVNFGQQTYRGFDKENSCDGCPNDNSDSSQGFYISYKYNHAYGLELGYLNLGSNSVVGILPQANAELTVSSDVKAQYLAATAMYRFSKKWTLTGRAGIASLKEDKSFNLVGFNSIPNISDSATEAIFGGSIDYNFNDSFKIGLRLDNVSSIHSIGLNLHVDF